MNYQFEAALCNISFLHNSCRQETLKQNMILHQEFLYTIKCSTGLLDPESVAGDR